MEEENSTQLHPSNHQPAQHHQLATTARLLMLTGCAAMLLVTVLLPLVNLMSYQLTIDVLPHKIGRLVHGTFSQCLGYVLLAGLVIAPVLLAVAILLRRHVSRLVATLPIAVSLVLIVLLLLASRPSPGLGLWLYLLVAVVTAVLSLWRPK